MTEGAPSKYPKWFWAFAVIVLFLTSLPYAFAYLTKPADAAYLGVHTNIDDHAVYAAWIKQAQEGRFFFENRFTPDPQPRLTIHLYFLALGWLSKVTGISLAMHIGRLIASLLFLMALYGLVRRIAVTDFQVRMAMVLSVFGAGVGWLMWRRYGHEGPIDVWQPEAFTFPSLMTNGLFATALWLMVVIWTQILDARASWKPVLPGFLAALVLANVHTYDVLLIALIGVAFLISRLMARDFDWIWLARTLVIALGAFISVLWFVYVRANDQVFAARADTLTFSPPLVQIILGLLPLLPHAIGLGIFATPDDKSAKWSLGSVFPAGLVLTVGTLAFASAVTPPQSFVLTPLSFIGLFAAASIVCAMIKVPDAAKALLICWSIVGIVVLYYPGVFQRKLAMGLSLPFGILAGIATAMLIEKVRHKETRTLLSAIVVVILSLSSLRWLQRELLMARDDISNTTVHSVYLSPDAEAIKDYLAVHKTDEDVLVAMPGLASRTGEDQFQVVVPDLNPIMTGWAGIKTYAGHWSETPDYANRRREVAKVFAPGLAPMERQALLSSMRATYVILPTSLLKDRSIALPGSEPVYAGSQFTLLAIRP